MEIILRILILAFIAIATIFGLRKGNSANSIHKNSLSAMVKDRASLLSLIALLFTFVSNILWFIYYDRDYLGYGYLYGPYYLNFRFDLYSVIGFLFEIAPIVLLCLYFFIKHNNTNAYRLVILATISNVLKVFLGFVLYGFTPIDELIAGIVLHFDVASLHYKVHMVLDILTHFYNIAIFITAILAFIGKTKNKFFAIMQILCFAFSILLLIDFCFTETEYYVQYQRYLYLLTLPCGHIGDALFFVVLWLVAKNNELPKYFDKKISKNLTTITPEMQLTALKEKFELGIITEEEYKTQRMEILAKL